MSKQVSLRSVEFSLLLPGFPDVFAFLKKQNKCRDFLRAKLLSSAIEGGGYGGWKSLRFRICVTLRNSNGSLNIPIGQRRMTNRVRSASASSWSSNPSGSKGDQRWPCRKPRVAVRGVTWLVHLLRNFVLNWILILILWFGRILQSMGPAPSADLVGSILGVDEEFKPRPALRKSSAQRSFSSSTAGVKGQAETAQAEKSCADSFPWTETPIVWRNVAIFVYLHAAAFYGFYLCFVSAKWATVVWGQ